MRESDFSKTDKNKAIHNQNINGGDISGNIDNLIHQLEMQMQKAKDEYDVESIRKTIEEIKQIRPLEHNFSPEDSLELFNQNYSEKAKHDKRAFDILIETEKSENIKYSERVSFKRLKTACIILVLFCCISSVTVILADAGVFKSLIKWTEEVANKRFSNIGDEINEELVYTGETGVTYYDYESIEEQYGITVFKPYYIPKEYYLESIQSYESDFQTDFFAIYSNGKDIINYNIVFLDRNNIDYNSNIEKNSGFVEVYTSMNIDFYIFENNNWFSATWDYMGLDYSIMGLTSIEEIVKFIDNLLF